MVGDLYQLQPVVTRDEENLFYRSYPTPYFFSANVFNRISFRFIELEVVYRQKDDDFLKLLQSIRVNSAMRKELEYLNKKFK